MRRIVGRSLVVYALVLALACSRSKSAQLDDLRAEASAVAAAQQPQLDALSARFATLKQNLVGNLPGWELKFRIAQAANDQLGLWPFEEPHRRGPEWKPTPTTLLGMGPYCVKRADELATQGKLDELQFLVADERRRYAEGIAAVDAQLTEVETWLATARAQPKP